MEKKLYFVGIDAVPLWLLQEMKDEKGMEGFKELLNSDSIINLESTLPPMTGPAWPSIYTGLEPREHGVPDFFEMKKDYTPELAFYDSRKFPPFWKALSDRGKKCLIVTPATDITLPTNMEYDIITGFPLPAETNNAEMEKLMKKYEFDGEPDIEKDIKSGKMSEETASKRFAESARKRIQIAREMMAKKDYDFVYVCFTETDRIHHFVANKPNRKDYLLPIYAEMGAFVSELLALAKKDNSALILVSDHGTQQIKMKFLLNSWLIKKGYVKLKDSIEKSINADAGKSNIKYELREKLLKTGLRRVYDKMPHAVKSATSKAVGSALSGTGGGKYIRTHLFDFEMPQTTAFAAISNDPVSTIWVNDNRLKNGIVTEKDKKALKAKLTRELKAIRGEDGKPVIANIFDGDSYYGKNTQFIAADLLIEATPGYTLDIFYHSKETNFMLPEKAKSGDHTRKGIFGFYPKRLYKKKDKTMRLTEVKKVVMDYFSS
jgi:predicted AlkP superfamily phosphohydrolase/phosphomutase